jgi:hypothetical protein
MKKFIHRFEPTDCIAILTLLMSFYLLALGKNGFTTAIIAGIIAFYFGDKISLMHKADVRAEKDAKSK